MLVKMLGDNDQERVYELDALQTQLKEACQQCDFNNDHLGYGCPRNGLGGLTCTHLGSGYYFKLKAIYIKVVGDIGKEESV
jgi:hypothetical protein